MVAFEDPQCGHSDRPAVLLAQRTERVTVAERYDTQWVLWADLGRLEVSIRDSRVKVVVV